MKETYRGTVYPWHCDHMGHMNVQHYAAKFDEATWQLFGGIGLTPDYLKMNRRGMVAVNQKTEYRAELLPGDLIVIASEIVNISRKSLVFRHIMKKCPAQQIVAETELVGVHIDTNSRKSCDFCREIYDRMRNALEESTPGVDSTN